MQSRKKLQKVRCTPMKSFLVLLLPLVACGKETDDTKLGQPCGGSSDAALVCKPELECREAFCTELCRPVPEGVADCYNGEGGCLFILTSNGILEPLCFPKCIENACKYGVRTVYRDTCLCL